MHAQDPMYLEVIGLFYKEYDLPRLAGSLLLLSAWPHWERAKWERAKWERAKWERAKWERAG
jgi:hypothetical protein